jgi:hypothetical protein
VAEELVEVVEHRRELVEQRAAARRWVCGGNSAASAAWRT